MKSKLFFILSFVLLGVSSCSSDDDKADVNFIRAKFNGTEQKFNIISVDKVDYPEEGYSDVEVTATMSSDDTKTFILKSEFGVTGEDIVWGLYYINDGVYYTNNIDNTNSNVAENSNGRYKGTFSGTLFDEDSGATIMLTEGSFDIIY